MSIKPVWVTKSHITNKPNRIELFENNVKGITILAIIGKLVTQNVKRHQNQVHKTGYMREVEPLLRPYITNR